MDCSLVWMLAHNHLRDNKKIIELNFNFETK
jgi:hypothetical protein